MEDPLAAAAAPAGPGAPSEAGSDDTRASGSSSSSQSQAGGNGTGVFIPACILDGSAMNNPSIAAKFPRRQRRGSACQTACDAPLSKPGAGNTSPSSGSDSVAERHNSSTSHYGANNNRAAGGRHQQGASSHSTSAKNPFAATPKNIRQQQLLCNLMAAADSFADPSGGAAAPSAGAAAGPASRAPSLDFGGMPPPVPGSASRGASLDYSGAAAASGRNSMDVHSNNMSRATSRSSLESCGWGYMNRGRAGGAGAAGQGRNSCDMRSNRQSMESYSVSMRSSMDRASCYSGRPSVDSTFSGYAPIGSAASPQQQQQQLLAAQQQQHVAATAAAAAAAAAVAARASYEAALPPTPAGNAINRMGMWQQQQSAGRASCDLGVLASSLGAAAACGFNRYSLDSSAAAAAAAAAGSALQMEQQHSLSGLLRFDSSAMSHVSGGSMEGCSSRANGCSPSGAVAPPSPEVAAAAAAMAAARQAQMSQLQQIIDSMSAGSGAISADTAATLATLTAQGIAPDAAALLLLQAQAEAAATNAASGSGGCSNNSNNTAPEAVLFQQQLQHIMQANQMAAAAAAASQLYAGAAVQRMQHQQQRNERWQAVFECDAAAAQAEADLQLREQGASLNAAMDAANLQQQLELLQRMQL